MTKKATKVIAEHVKSNRPYNKFIVHLELYKNKTEILDDVLLEEVYAKTATAAIDYALKLALDDYPEAVSYDVVKIERLDEFMDVVV